MIKVTWTASQRVEELEMLQNHLEGEDINRVLEIGTLYGGTTMLWAKMVKPKAGKVYTVDMNFRKDGQVYSNTEWEEVVTEIQGDSHSRETKEKVSDLIEEPVDLLFIDGDHSYEGVKQDFYNYHPFVRTGGFVVFHDIIDTEYHRNLKPPDGPVMVAIFWNEIKDQYKYWEFVAPNAKCMGIGILQKA